jgi:hypothetical protein
MEAKLVAILTAFLLLSFSYGGMHVSILFLDTKNFQHINRCFSLKIASLNSIRMHLFWTPKQTAGTNSQTM